MKVKKSSTMMDVDEITARKNIINLFTLDILHDIAQSKNIKMNSIALKV
jgi:hypothetical protein